MTTLRSLFRIALMAALLGALGLSPLAQVTSEGYDPMLQITHQFARPDIYIIADVSGSMAWDQWGSSVGVDSTGTYPSASWSMTSSSCSSGKCKKYVYTLTISQTAPSRMSTMKNALGNSVNIVSAWLPPEEWTTDTSYGYFNNGKWNGSVSGPKISYNATYRTYAWTVTYKNYTADPGEPFTAYDASGKPTVGTGGEYLPAADLIGQTKDLVNWGLITFSGSNCSTQTTQVAVDNNDTGDVTAIEDKMKLNSAGGLGSGGSTPTRGAIEYAKSQITAAFDADGRYQCGRTYACILMTDGLSNNCNPGNDNWIDPCTGVVPYACDAGSSGYDCEERNGKDRNYTAFPAGRAEELWNLDLSRNGSTPQKVRTWVIGVSDAVSPCELNFTAYMGRTDASSPNGDAGFSLSKDPYLPTAIGDQSKFDPTHGNYAYFARSSEALTDAFAAIVAAVASGDYTTSAPVASSALSAGTMGILSTAEYPGWRGHVYAYNTSSDPSTLVWDAGETLSDPSNSAYVSPANRKIYTWDASNNLIEIKNNQLSNIQDAAAVFTTGFNKATLTSAVLDFIRGNDGGGTGRAWRLGPIINSTPAITEGPLEFTLGTLPSHASFEQTYKDRTKLVWVGSNDGMLHAFKLETGQEVLALIPPNLLAMQVDLYNNYTANPVKNPVGQPQMPGSQKYGVAGSPRYADVYFGSPTNDYRTVMLVSQGPGGNLLAGLDITSVVTGDTNASDPKVLWTKTGDTLAGLYKTWSTPAMAATSSSGTSATWTCIAGGGFDASSTGSSQKVPRAFTFDPTNGGNTSAKVLGSDTTNSYVGNQAFSDTVIYSMTADAYYPDNLADLALQPDLKGIIWFLPKTGFTPSVGINVSSKAGQVQPLYYPPAVSGFTASGTKVDIYAFGSGTFYEKDQDITGQDVGKTGYFVPSLFIVTKGQNTTAASIDEILQIKIQDLFRPNADGTPSSYHLGRRSQLSAPPALFTPVSGSGSPVALFLVYDPDSDKCGGTSYIVKITLDIVGGKPSAKSTSVYEAGEGAASGFAIAGTAVIVARSGVGEGKKASLGKVPGLNPTQGLASPTPVWWRELK